MTEAKKAGRGRAKTLVELRREAERAAEALKKAEEKEAARQAAESKAQRAKAEDAAITKAIPRLLRVPAVRDFLLAHLNSEAAAAAKDGRSAAPAETPSKAAPDATTPATHAESPATDVSGTPAA